ncbi:MAG TPA: energy-coupling factor transporter transmembrane component T [bacterium]|nr:energy-coupling factor transporter transmembrane component T [bacterium]
MRFHRYLNIGRYEPGASLAHRADPRAKLLVTLAFAITVFFADDWHALGYCALFPLAGLALSRVAPALVLGNLRGMWIIFLMTLLFTAGAESGEILWESTALGLFISREGIMHGLLLCGQLALAVVAFGLLTATTTVFEQSAGIERLGAPLTRWGVPVADFAMMLALAVRFFPVLTEEIETVIRAQTARGAPFERGGPLNRLRAIAAVLVPVFMRTFRHAGDMAVAMECRLYGIAPQRTALNPLCWRALDSLLICLALAALLPLLLR